MALHQLVIARTISQQGLHGGFSLDQLLVRLHQQSTGVLHEGSLHSVDGALVEGAAVAEDAGDGRTAHRAALSRFMLALRDGHRSINKVTIAWCPLAHTDGSAH